MTRALILSAELGAGHDLPAELLADALRERGAEATIADGLTEMGEVTRTLGRRGAETIVRRAPVVFDIQYWLIQRFPPTRRLGAWLLEWWGRRGLLRLIARERPDVIVSTYPGTTDVLGRMRRAGRLSIPCVAAITDLAALRFWAHAGIDRHLIIHEQSRAEVEAIAGAHADIRHVRGFSRPQFDDPPTRTRARAALELPPARSCSSPAAAGASATCAARRTPHRRSAQRPSCCAGRTPSCALGWNATACAPRGSPRASASGWRRPTCSCTRPRA